MIVRLLVWLLLLASPAAANDFYNHGSYPTPGSPATSAGLRAELDLIGAGFDKLPSLGSPNANKLVVVNPTGTSLTTLQHAIVLGGDFETVGAYDLTLNLTGFTSLTLPETGTLVTRAGVDTLTNKTITSPAISSPAFSGTATGNLDSTGTLQFTGSGGNAIGTARANSYQFMLGGSHTAPAGIWPAALYLGTTLNPTANTNGFAEFIVPTINKAVGGTHDIFASLAVWPPTIGASSSNLTKAASLYIQGAPTAGTNNYALLVDGGASRFAGAATFDSTVTTGSLISSSMTSNGAITALGNLHTSGTLNSAAISNTGSLSTGPLSVSGAISATSNATVAGYVRVQGSANPYIGLHNGSSESYLQIVSGRLDLHANGDISFDPGGTERGRFLASTGALDLDVPLPTGSGGLGISTTPSNGRIPIGNGSSYTSTTLTAGTGISISNGAGSVTITNSLPVPTGTIVMYGSATPPSGWLLCDGSSISRSTFSALFAVIGTSFGSFSGATFNVPDLRGRNPMGVSGAYPLGSTGGEASHTLTTAEMPSHAHTYWSGFGSGDSGVPVMDGDGNNPDRGKDTSSTGGGGAHNVLDPYQAVHFIIKTKAKPVYRAYPELAKAA